MECSTCSRENSFDFARFGERIKSYLMTATNARHQQDNLNEIA
jgi:hypothetical protein